MGERNSSAASGGISVAGLLGVAFVVLKLCKVIDWSWWWVTAPFWGPFALLLSIAALCFIVWAMFTLVLKAMDRYERRRAAKRREAEQAAEASN